MQPKHSRAAREVIANLQHIGVWASRAGLAVNALISRDVLACHGANAREVADSLDAIARERSMSTRDLLAEILVTAVNNAGYPVRVPREIVLREYARGGLRAVKAR